MKKLFIILFFLPLFSFSQNWCQSGATWYYDYSDNPWLIGYYKIEYTGDTTINSILCKKLHRELVYYSYIFQNVYVMDYGVAFTYADADKVYLYEHNQFYTMYNFAAQVGDTWTLPEIQHFDGCDSVGVVRVDSIGTTIIDNQTLRYVCVSLLDTNQKWGWVAKIVERIGTFTSYVSYPYSYLLPQKFDYCGMPIDSWIEGGDLRCYSDNSPFYYSSGISPSCDFINSISEQDNLDEVNIFPNPSRGLLNVVINRNDIVEVKLYDLLGAEVYAQRTINKNLKINNLKGGTYLLVLVDKENRTVMRRIVTCR